jgi:hypothetical protein
VSEEKPCVTEDSTPGTPPADIDSPMFGWLDGSPKTYRPPQTSALDAP